MFAEKSWGIGNKTAIVLLIMILILIIFYKPIIHSDITIVCGEFIEEGEVRGVTVYVFEYKTTEGITYRVSESKNHFTVQPHEFSKIDCLKLEYSNIWNFSGGVIDERVKKEN
jgi:hypothetical protein